MSGVGGGEAGICFGGGVGIADGAGAGNQCWVWPDDLSLSQYHVSGFWGDTVEVFTHEGEKTDFNAPSENFWGPNPQWTKPSPCV